MLANVQIYKYLTVSLSTNNNLEVLRIVIRRNTPTQNNGELRTCVARISMCPDSGAEPCGSGTRPTEWEPDNTADVMIGMCTDSHHHQQGTTVHVEQCFKIMHVITVHTIHFDLWMNNGL